MSRVRRTLVFILMLCNVLNVVAEERNVAPFGRAAANGGTFPPSQSQYSLDGQVHFPFRLEFRLDAQPNDVSRSDWRITISSGKFHQVIDRNSISATDGTFMSGLLDPSGASIQIPPGAPTLQVLETITARDFGHALSVYPDTNNKPPFIAIRDALRDGTYTGALANNLSRAAKGLGWMVVEDHHSGNLDGCTVFVIAPSLLLTARHCFPDLIDTGLVARVWIRSNTDSRDNAPTFDRVSLVWSDSNYNQTTAGLDAMVLRTATAVPVGDVLKLARDPARDTQKIAILQFPAQAELSLSNNPSCSITAVVSGTPFILHTCNSDSGSSGSPIMDAGLSAGVLGIHVQGFATDATEESKGVSVTSVLAAIRATNPGLFQEIQLSQGEVKW